MGTRGPVPKRSEERIRRNDPVIEVTRVEMSGVVEQPELGLVDPHPIVVDLWRSLGESGQSRFYEPSDYEYARFVLHFADSLLKQDKPNAQLFQGVTSSLSDLLVSEGARRRVAMEIERQKQGADVLNLTEHLRRRLEEL